MLVIEHKRAPAKAIHIRHHSLRLPATRWCYALLILSIASTQCVSLSAADSADITTIAHVDGGLCVNLGSGDASLALALAVAHNPRFIIHCLESDNTVVTKVQNELIKQGKYGQISIEKWDGKNLPYADNVVNALLVQKPSSISEEEMLRVLVPGGVICRQLNGKWQRTEKPRPAGMDNWPQWRHGPDRNPVSEDTLVEVPSRIQWLSFQGNQGKEMVTAGGRYYSGESGLLRVRDAFNGLPLWNEKIDRKIMPVATQQGVIIVTKEGHIRYLDGGTGKMRREYINTGKPDILLLVPSAAHAGGLLIVSNEESLVTYQVDSGEIVWRKNLKLPRGLSVGSQPDQLMIIHGDTKSSGPLGTVMAVDLLTGDIQWQRNDLPWAKTCYRSSYGNGVFAFEAGRFAIPKGLEEDKSAITAIHFLSAKDGQTIKEYPYKPAMRHDENPRAFFVDGKVAMHQAETKQQPTTLAIFDDLTRAPKIMPTVHERSFIQFCFPPVATERFFIYGPMGFTDWKTFEHFSNPITRGSCGRDSEGIIPANGLIYVFPKSCSCFSMLNGVAALSPAYAEKQKDTTELIKGTAFTDNIAGKMQAGDWPLYRGDANRSGSSTMTVPADVHQLWTVKIPAPDFKGPALEEWEEFPFSTGPLTPPVIAEGVVIIAQPHTHRVMAFSAEQGKPLWSFTANGRIDSAPTITNGLCLFGSRSGWVFCVRLSDGELVWKQRMAPNELRIVHCGQVESPWPIAGSVLVDEGVAYASAGIHPLTDGGLRVYAFDPRTGKIKWQQIVTDMGYNERTWRGRLGLEQDYMDLMVRDGNRIALSRWLFDIGTGKNEYLFQNAFYRLGENGAYMPRGTWSYGYPMNRPRVRRPLQVGQGQAVFGINKGASPDKFRWEPTGGAPIRQEPKLFRRDFKPNEKFDVQWVEQKNDTESRIGLYFPANRSAENSTWSAAYPGWVEAMALAGDNLFLFADKKLTCIAAKDGKKLSEIPMAQPVWDGLAAAGGCLFITTMDGQLSCFGR